MSFAPHASPGETAAISSGTRVEKSTGNEFKISRLVNSSGDNKEYYLRAATSVLRDQWVDCIAREICGAGGAVRDSENASVASGRYVVR